MRISVGSSDTHHLQHYEIKRTIFHPDNRIKLALMELKEELKMSESVQAIALPNNSENIPADTKCLLTGWGSTETEHFPSKLHGSNLKMLTCESVDVTNICAGPVKRDVIDRNAYLNDWGDPLACSVGTEAKLVGVASKTVCPCNKNRVLPYISVANVRSWINEITGL